MKRLITIMDLKDFIDQQEQMLVIDIREPQEFNEYHIDGSMNIPLNEFSSNIHKVPRKMPVYLICMYGLKSEGINVMLRQDHHYTNVFNVLGGMYEWISEYAPEAMSLLENE